MIRFSLFAFCAMLVLSACQTGKSSQSEMGHAHTNALIHSTSPYLLQHAHNPVDWHPWGEEAFEKARLEDKLVLISVGYSACHWCHVMERETFEDSTAAAYMNEHFVSIKVDREERPDVDQVYMTAVQLMTERGGWPMNCFTLTDGKPIYGGTYFPKDNWMKLMKELVQLKNESPEKLREYAEKLTDGIQQSERIVNLENPDDEIDFDRNSFVANWSVYWDRNKGGPNRAPKFPMPNNYEYLLHRAWQDSDAESQAFALTTLDAMARGGIYDQIGGGFARYSTDMDWKAPHFEKMLYDNGQLISLYSKAYQITQDDEYRRAVEQSIAFINRELTSKEGLFYSALDADSEGEEGKFYIWNEEDIKAAVGEAWSWVKDYYSVNSKGRWEGHYILLRSESDSTFAKNQGWSLAELHSNVDQVNAQLMKKRSGRIRPGLDDKILTSWNGLMVTGLVNASAALQNKSYATQAERSLTMLLKAQMDDDGRLNHSYKEGKSTINGYLEDYAFVIEACLTTYQHTFEEHWLDKAKTMSDYVITHFSDPRSGMFFFTSDLDSPLIARQTETSDNVIPASNSQMAKNLFLLGSVLGEDSYKMKSKQMLQNILPSMTYGPGYSNWAQLAMWMQNPLYEVAFTGPDAQDLNTKWRARYLPNTITLGAQSASNLPLLEGKFMGENTIYVCVDKSCKLPVSTINEALELLHD